MNWNVEAEHYRKQECEKIGYLLDLRQKQRGDESAISKYQEKLPALNEKIEEVKSDINKKRDAKKGASKKANEALKQAKLNKIKKVIYAIMLVYCPIVLFFIVRAMIQVVPAAIKHGGYILFFICMIISYGIILIAPKYIGMLFCGEKKERISGIKNISIWFAIITFLYIGCIVSYLAKDIAVTASIPIIPCVIFTFISSMTAFKMFNALPTEEQKILYKETYAQEYDRLNKKYAEKLNNLKSELSESENEVSSIEEKIINAQNEIKEIEREILFYKEIPDFYKNEDILVELYTYLTAGNAYSLNHALCIYERNRREKLIETLINKQQELEGAQMYELQKINGSLSSQMHEKTKQMQAQYRINMTEVHAINDAIDERIKQLERQDY